MVLNGMIANQTTFNTAFVSRTAATTSTAAIVSLINTAIASGASVNNVQALLNKLIEGIGTTGETDADINNYASNNYVIDGQSRKEAIEALDTQLGLTQADLDIAENAIAVAEIDILALMDEVDLINNADSTFGGNKTFSNDVVVNGNMTVNGTTTTINSSTVDSVDPNVTINKTGNDVTSEGAGFTVDRTGTKGSFIYGTALTSKWALGALGAEAEVVTVSHAQTITNKLINGANNTITNINLTSAVTGALPIANGGTGQTSAAAAYAALAPLTTKGDLIVRTATAPTRLPVGADGFALVADAASAEGVKWAAVSGGSTPAVHVSAVNNSAQVIPATTLTVLTGWTESTDTDGIFNATTGVCTIPSGGGAFMFLLDVTQTSPTSGDCLIGIYKNGTKAREAISPFNTAGSGQTTRHVAYLDSFTAGDTVDFRAFGATSTTILNAKRTSLIVIKIK